MADRFTTLVETQTGIEVAADNYRVQIQKSANFAWRSVQPLFRNNLQIDAPLEGQNVGRVSNNEENRALVLEGFDVFFRSVATPTTQQRIDDITAMFTPITTGVQTYYTNEIAPPPIATINQATTETALNRTNWIAFTNTIRFEVLNPVLREWQNLLGNATLTEFMNRTEYLILDHLVTYTAPRAHASMQNHYRQMSSLIGTDLQLVWVRYVRETSTAERRQFCVDHESGFEGNRGHYHVNEIKRTWPLYEGGDWDGVIPGTNAENILERGGGYNCLHTFRFVKASDVSQSDRDEARRNGAIIPF